VQDFDGWSNLQFQQYIFEIATEAWENQEPSTMVFSGNTWLYQITPYNRKHYYTSQDDYPFNEGWTVFKRMHEGAPYFVFDVELEKYLRVDGDSLYLDENYLISFLVITDSLDSLGSLSRTLWFLGAGVILVAFIINYKLANRSIIPISENWAKQKQFVADASHELKTPLTTIITNCSALRANNQETISSQIKWLEAIEIGTDRMTKLVNNLLLLARAEGIPEHIEKLPFAMRDLIAEVIKQFEATANTKNLQITQNLPGDIEVIGFRDYIKQILIVFYENAVKYSDEGGQIEISARKLRGSIACSVKNTGRGITKMEMPYIFDRFYRADVARSSDANSYGLGLPIAKSLADQIGGKITVKSIIAEWTEFTITFNA
jgi:signal transduction histidine kinase